MAGGPRSPEIDERYYVDAAARTLQLLKVVADVDGPISLASLVSELGWTKPSVYRLVRTLEAIGGLRMQEDRGYVLGPALITIGQAALRATRLQDIARPRMEALREQLDETIVLTVLDGDEVVYVDRIEADKILIPRTRLGSRLPAYATSTGQVLLSGLDDEEVARRLKDREFEQLAPNTLRDLDELMERLAQVRRRGYAINDEELTVGHRSAAAPIRDRFGAVVAAVSVSVPAARASRAQLTEFATKALVPVAEEISTGLGAAPVAP